MYDDDFEDKEGVSCPECGEFEYLNPESGLCFDCDELDRDEDDEDEDDLEPCSNCLELREPDELDDGVCPECEEALESE